MGGREMVGWSISKQMLTSSVGNKQKAYTVNSFPSDPEDGLFPSNFLLSWSELLTDAPTNHLPTTHLISNGLYRTVACFACIWRWTAFGHNWSKVTPADQLMSVSDNTRNNWMSPQLLPTGVRWLLMQPDTCKRDNSSCTGHCNTSDALWSWLTSSFVYIGLSTASLSVVLLFEAELLHSWILTKLIFKKLFCCI